MLRTATAMYFIEVKNMFQLDFKLFHVINHLAVSEKPLDPIVAIFTEYGQYLFLAGLLFYWFYPKKKNRKMVMEAFLGVCLAMAINAAIGHFFYRDRPFVHHHVYRLIPHAENASFPSDHAAGSFVIAAAIWIWMKRDGWVWMILAAALSISRVWTGVHYPSDVLAGMLIGIGAAFIIHCIFKRLPKLNEWANRLIEFYENIESKVWKKTA
ncbi:undecaprenyl-diphosphatase [Falsibacillus albus]|uniref:Undecaprenyl-diphosphatase n=1 Tax=Falsibacillus albus TaxID=2478915 RepID=A0A3L7JHK6_9BACI|nr:undecaprenyl-diphosphatase [Falsibacillus albus]RLQ89980.1 undecaprenyl-diphosphatase [Falsibacillus albus]